MAVLGWALLTLAAALLSLVPSPAPAATNELVLTGTITVRSIHRPGVGTELDFTLTDDQGVRTGLLIDRTVLATHGGARALDGQRATIVGEPALVPPNAVRVREIRLGSPADPTLRSTNKIGEADDAAMTELAGALAVTRRYATLLCRFADMPGVTPHPLSWFETLMTSAQYPSLAHYFSTASYGALSLAGSVVKGWYTLPFPRSTYVSGGSFDLDALADDCTAAADADVDFRQFSGINLMFNGDLPVSVGGTWFITREGIQGLYGVTWIPSWGYANQGLVAHEMGHSLGLSHSSGPYGSPYDSLWDVMSEPRAMCRERHPTYGCVGQGTIAYHKDSLGWIPAARRHVVPAGTVTTLDLDFLAEPATATNPLIAKIPINGSSTNFYTVEARNLAGYDREIPAKAVLIHEVTSTLDDREAQLVDADHNGNPNDAGAVWLPGETFTDAAHGISVHVVAETPTGFQVTIASGATQTETLTAARSGDGAGRITSTPAGIDCGADCSHAYATLSVIRLRATPSAGSIFTGWTGGGCSGTSDCFVTMTAAQTVTARFMLASSLAPDLVVTALSDPPATAVRSARFPLTTTVANQGDGVAASSRLRFYLSANGVWDATDVLLATSISMPSLAIGATRTSTVTVTVPATTPSGLYTVLACADDLKVVTERDETNNCKTSATQVSLQAPDLAVTALGDPPATLARGGRMTVSETVTNIGTASAPGSRVRYYLSVDGAKGVGDPLLSGTRTAGTLAPGAVSSKTMTVTVPLATPPGTYHLLACADDLNDVLELVETNNCRSSAGRVVIGP